MRAYRLSRMTDEQVIQLHQDSVREFEEHKRQQAEAGKKFWADREERRRACESNPAAKLRDPNHCFEFLPLTIEDIGKPLMGWETPDKFFENSLTEFCQLADSVHKAKRIGCLP